MELGLKLGSGVTSSVGVDVGSGVGIISAVGLGAGIKEVAGSGSTTVRIPLKEGLSGTLDGVVVLATTSDELLEFEPEFCDTSLVWVTAGKNVPAVPRIPMDFGVNTVWLTDPAEMTPATSVDARIIEVLGEAFISPTYLENREITQITYPRIV